MLWQVSNRSGEHARILADRHYSRQKVGSPQFVPPGRCLVLLTECSNAVWTTSWPYAQFTHHDWAGAWICSIFRNESEHLSSTLITQAVAATLWRWPEPPAEGFVTFVDADKVRSTNPGYCFMKAGWEPVGYTKVRHLKALHLPLDRMPDPTPPIGQAASMFADVGSDE